MASNQKRIASGGSSRQSGGQAELSEGMANLGLEDAKKLSEEELVGKRVDLPPEAYIHGAPQDKTFTARPTGGLQQMSKSRNAAELNVYRVNEFTNNSIHMYSVSIERQSDKGKKDKDKKDPPRGLAEKVWMHINVQTGLRFHGGVHWMFNGVNIAWSTPRMAKDEERFEVDLGRSQIFTLVIRYTKQINMSVLPAYLKGTMSWDNSVTEVLNFLDHAIRHTPSRTRSLIGKSFYSRVLGGQPGGQPATVQALEGSVLELVKGSFASFRISSIPGKPMGGLVVNVDVANTVFWQPLFLRNVVTSLIPGGLKRPDNQLQAALLPTQSPNGNMIVRPAAFNHLRRLIRLKFRVVLPNATTPSNMVHTIKGFYFDERFGTQGANVTNVEFEKTDDGKTQRTTVFKHYKEKYQYEIRGFDLRYPLVESMKGSRFPLEICKLEPLQRFRYKLDRDMTSEMIKWTVSDPGVRRGNINSVVGNLDWPGDTNLGAFGISIERSMLKSQPYSLGLPSIHCAGNETIKPTPSATYNIQRKKFYRPELIKPKVLRRVAWVGVDRCCNQNLLREYAKAFQKAYRDQGGSYDASPTNRYTEIFVTMANNGVSTLLRELETEFPPGETSPFDIIFFVIPKYDTYLYDSIKRHMDCGVKIPSQVLVGEKLKRANGRHWSNIGLKVHAKLFGTAFVATKKPASDLLGTDTTMMIGLDVSHGAPGTDQPSMAAMSVSLDEHTAFYGANCQTNGYRQEIVDLDCMRSLLHGLLHHWSRTLRGGRLPKHLLFFRDGVSEGQFQQVLDTEVTAIKQVFKGLNSASDVKVTVIIATKRHHIRAFMQTAYSNPSPGTLIEDVATHPKHWDFFLYSHNAQLGTSRPVHYHVIRDEIGFNRTQLPKLIYEQCFQYCRCPSAVSLHPAVYYAHLASKRASAHLPDAPMPPDGRAPKLYPIMALQSTMWFV